MASNLIYKVERDVKAGIYLPKDSAQLHEWSEVGSTWMRYIEREGKRLQPDLNDEGIYELQNSVIGLAIMKINGNQSTGYASQDEANY